MRARAQPSGSGPGSRCAAGAAPARWYAPRRRATTGAWERGSMSEGLSVPAEEGAFGQGREQRGLLTDSPVERFAGLQLAYLAAVDEHGHRPSGFGLIRDRQLPAPGHDERPHVKRVWRDERDRHRLEPPDEHRPAVREVVG